MVLRTYCVPVPQNRNKSPGKTALIEFYDYYIYGTAAALVLNKLFFPALSPVAGTLASLATFAIGFVARPVGAIIFGHFGDRIGRKATLVVSLLLMGLSTAFVGLLPSYASIGVAAPILLVVLRVLQGIGLGGEWGGAALLSTEYAPRGRRGLYAAAPQMGSPIGFFAATALYWALSEWLPKDAFDGWGWRVPFLLSFVLVAVGLRIRLRVAETPAFAKFLATAHAAKVPTVEVVRRYPKQLLLGAGAIVIVYVMFYTASTYCLTYTTKNLGVPRNTVLGLSLIAVTVLGVSTYVVARGSDVLGRRRLMLAGAVFSLVWSLVMFPLLNTRNPILIAVSLSGALLCMGIVWGPLGAFLPELFGTEVRYSGAGIAYNLGGVLGGGAAPLIVAQLGQTRGTTAVGFFMAAMAVISLVSILALPETRHRELSEV
ncbi:MHS family MFS transporter [Nocardia sp. NEAU-G5]|uniref:MHS family MFS transporter n=1 Tax=Nocardia albiluteola TaxID=2842303 RepID=A0ABS6B2S4_9NOCA|nr:MFS transporter [Nocardia albiluteola]MBU3064095.1 MHS family MFS transporter [Nocardia albiluteola]